MRSLSGWSIPKNATSWPASRWRSATACMYDSAPPRRYRYLLTWRMRISSDVIAAAGKVVGQAGVELGCAVGAQALAPRPGPPGVEPKRPEARLEGVGPCQSEKLEHGGGPAARVVEDVLVADLQPSFLADLPPGVVEGVEQQLPRQPGEQHERTARRLPLLVVGGREGTEVPAFGAEVAAPPIGLQPGRGDGSTVAHDVHVARAGEHTVDEAGAGPTRELVQEQRCPLGGRPLVEEATESLGQPGNGIRCLEVAHRLGDERRNVALEGAGGLRWCQPHHPLARGGRRQTPVDAGLHAPGGAAADAVVDVGDEPHVGVT